jgi:hypothetical protein
MRTTQPPPKKVIEIEESLTPPNPPKAQQHVKVPEEQATKNGDNEKNVELDEDISTDSGKDKSKVKKSSEWDMFAEQDLDSNFDVSIIHLEKTNPKHKIDNTFRFIF